MVTNVLQLLCIYARKQNEVIVIRRILTCTVSVLLLLGAFLLPMRAEAATADSKAGVVTTASGRLNVRSSPSSSAAVAASLNKGSYVTLISRSGDWWKVEYAKGKYGYCHAGFITVTEGTPVSVAVSSGTLNVRSGAGTAYGKGRRPQQGGNGHPSVHCERMEPRPLRRNENRIRQRAISVRKLCFSVPERAEFQADGRPLGGCPDPVHPGRPFLRSAAPQRRWQ